MIGSSAQLTKRKEGPKSTGWQWTEQHYSQQLGNSENYKGIFLKTDIPLSYKPKRNRPITRFIQNTEVRPKRDQLKMIHDKYENSNSNTNF